MKYQLLTFLALTLITPVIFAEAQVTLINGDILKGEITHYGNGAVNFKHPVLGEINLKDEQVISIIPDTTSIVTDNSTSGANSQTSEINSGTQATQEKILASESVVKEDHKPITWLEDWNKQLDVGISGTDGNSQSQNIHIALSAKTESKHHRWDLQTAYDSSEEDGEKSRDEFFAEANRDWLISESSYFYFASGRFDWDEFQDWDYRINLAGGAGKDFIQEEKWTLRGKAGIGFNREFGGDDDSISPEGLLELASTWQLSKDHKIELKTTFYPQLDELREFRNITSLAWVNKLNDSMRLKVGLSNEHDTDVPDDIKKNDFKYATSLSWDL